MKHKGACNVRIKSALSGVLQESLTNRSPFICGARFPERARKRHEQKEEETLKFFFFIARASS